MTLAGRIHVPYQGYRTHVALLHAGAFVGGAKLWYDRSRKRFYLLVSLTIETPDPQPADQKQIIGIDLGQRYLATVATTTNGAQFYSGKKVRAKAGPLCPPAKTTSAQRHSQRHTLPYPAGPARETVEAEYQPCDEQAHSEHPS